MITVGGHDSPLSERVAYLETSQKVTMNCQRMWICFKAFYLVEMCQTLYFVFIFFAGLLLGKGGVPDAQHSPSILGNQMQAR